jgi:hypothetical protein
MVGMLGGDAAERGDHVSPGVTVSVTVVGFAQVMLDGDRQVKLVGDDV